jgi:hypothetical protein
MEFAVLFRPVRIEVPLAPFRWRSVGRHGVIVNDDGLLFLAQGFLGACKMDASIIRPPRAM